MKITNYILLFLAVVMGMVVSLDNSALMMLTANRLRLEYNRSIDSAIDDSVRSVLESVDEQASINLDKVASSYFNSLYAGMGASDSPTEQELLRVHTPVLAVVEEDGVQVLYHAIGTSGVTQQWSPKFYYTYDGAGYAINFSLDSKVTLVIDGCNSTFNGNWYELKDKYPIDVDGKGTVNQDCVLLQSYIGSIQQFKSEEEFEKFRKSTITSTIVDSINYYVNKHNDVADVYGITYSFSLPESFTSTAARAVDDVSVLSVFQGYPLGGGTSERYTKYSLGGARLEKSEGYWVATASSGATYYHRANCGLKGASKIRYNSREECAAEGAYPCPYCNP